MALIKANLLIEQFGVVIPQAYCKIIGITWRDTEETTLIVEMMCYWSKEDKESGKQGFLKSYRIPINENELNIGGSNNIEMYNMVRGLLYGIIKQYDPSFENAVDDP